ncbi:MAG: hypothetical protein QXD34_04070 [Candidatus Bathyarchaeia archaeon]|nr:hypothetical protein [Candidatus Bathyarchaeota archaeon]
MADEDRITLEKFHEEFLKFKKSMEELRFLKLIAEDLKSFRRMLRFKKYD